MKQECVVMKWQRKYICNVCILVPKIRHISNICFHSLVLNILIFMVPYISLVAPNMDVLRVLLITSGTTCLAFLVPLVNHVDLLLRRRWTDPVCFQSGCLRCSSTSAVQSRQALIGYKIKQYVWKLELTLFPTRVLTIRRKLRLIAFKV